MSDAASTIVIARRTWTQLVDFGAFVTWVEGLLVDLLAIGVDNKGRHDLLLLFVGTRNIENDLLRAPIELNVQLVDLDLCGAVQTRAVTVGLEDIAGQDS
jgi:hypothetical protein